MSQSGNILIDIRSVDEKEDAGIPLLPDMSEWLGWGWVWLCSAHARCTGRGGWRSQLLTRLPPAARAALACSSGCLHQYSPLRTADAHFNHIPAPPSATTGKYAELEFVEVGDDRLEERLRNSTEVEAEVRRRGCLAWLPSWCGDGTTLSCGAAQLRASLRLSGELTRPSSCSAMFCATAQPASPLYAPVQLTAVELAALKQLNRGQTLYLLDQSGETAKAGGGQRYSLAGVSTSQWGGEALPLPPRTFTSWLTCMHQVSGCLQPLLPNCRCRSQPAHPLRPAPALHPPVARELTKRGFSKVFVVSGGCDAWTAAKLRTKRWEGEGFTTLRAPSALDEIIQVCSCVQRTSVAWQAAVGPQGG